MNIYDQIASRLEAAPDVEVISAFRSGKITTAGGLLQKVRELEAVLKPMLPPEKSVVSVCLPNGEDCIATVLCLWKLGHAVMPLPSALASGEIARIMRHGPAAVMIHERSKEFTETPGDTAALIGPQVFRRFKENGVASFSMDDLAFVRFTSGTTEYAKGVLISHRAIAERAASFGRALDLCPGKSVLWHLDMSYHFTTSIVSFLMNLCRIHLGNVLLPARFKELMAAPGVDYFFSLPFFYEQLCQFAPPLSFGKESKLYVTGQMVTAATLQRFRELYQRPILRMYGVIEIGIPVLHGEGDDPCVLGRLTEPYEIKLGERGQLNLRGPGTFAGYLMGENFRYEAFQKDWFNTGDLAEVTSSGEVRLLGREKEMIVTAGLKFFPSEVEEVLNSFAGVVRSSVFLMKTGDGKDRLMAVYESDGEISASKLEIQLEAHARKFLEHSKVPEAFLRVDSIPLTASGKVSRRAEDFARVLHSALGKLT